MEPVPYLYHSTQFAQCQRIFHIFSSFSTFSQFFILCFCAICILFFIKFTRIFFLLPFSCSTCSAVPCFFCSICSTFLFFTIFSTIATVSAAISSPFAQSFCPFAAYKLVLFHFYFIQEKETPSLFRSSVSDICSSSVLSQFRKMMQNSVIPCFVIFRYFLLFGRSHPQSAPSPQSSFRQSCG